MKSPMLVDGAKEKARVLKFLPLVLLGSTSVASQCTANQPISESSTSNSPNVAPFLASFCSERIRSPLRLGEQPQTRAAVAPGRRRRRRRQRGYGPQRRQPQQRPLPLKLPHERDVFLAAGRPPLLQGQSLHCFPIM